MTVPGVAQLGPWKGNRLGGGVEKVPVCFIYGTAKKKRPGYLVATNWPIEKALHQIPTK